MPDNIALFRSQLHHAIKRSPEEFLLKHLENDSVTELWHKGEKLKALYLLSCIDELSIRSELPLCSDWEDIRKHRFTKQISFRNHNDSRPPLKEFIKHNIDEVTLNDVY